EAAVSVQREAAAARIDRAAQDGLERGQADAAVGAERVEPRRNDRERSLLAADIAVRAKHDLGRRAAACEVEIRMRRGGTRRREQRERRGRRAAVDAAGRDDLDGAVSRRVTLDARKQHVAGLALEA